MNRTRVYELAQKLGVDNKEIIARLKSIGVEVKITWQLWTRHCGKVVGAPGSYRGLPGEVRVKPTLIRRRPKIVEEPIAAQA